jgi:hypothetical protein
MKRRDMFRLIPLAVPGIAAFSKSAGSQNTRQLPFGGGPREPFAMVYTRRIREMLQWVRANQSENILEAAYAIARTVEKGNRCWGCWDLGHTSSSDLFPGRNGEPEIVTPGYDPKQVKNGDLVLASFPWPPGYMDDIAKKDLFVIGAPCPWGGDIPGVGNITPDIQKLKIRPLADIWIETNVDHIGAQVKVPGSLAPLGPESGPLSGTLFWMMLADACRVLARDGKTVKVKGDEPVLTDKIPRMSLDAPLMDDYFDTVMMQLEMIGMEMGDIRKMAGLAVDSLLSGGNLYFYSRYPESLANEAEGRRGGFSFAKGLWDGSKPAGTAKDCVIMGTYKPDDEADIKNLDLFRSLGMKAVSIGPVTRDLKVAEGNAVFRKTDVHVGRMMDTYGLFALPGFERKVCPTSGILATSILWAVSAEIVQQVMDRTGGNVPAINFNGALKWGTSYDNQVNAMSQSRGY